MPVCLVFLRRWEKKLSAGNWRKTRRQALGSCARCLHGAASAEHVQLDHRGGHNGSIERDAKQRTGRHATPTDIAETQVFDGKLVDRCRADGSVKPDILSRRQSGRLRGTSNTDTGGYGVVIGRHGGGRGPNVECSTKIVIRCFFFFTRYITSSDKT